MSSRETEDRSAPTYAVPALDKALDVLEALAARGGMTQAELARATGRGPNELFRVLIALERRGYLLRDPATGAYALSLRLFELTRMHSPHETLLTAAALPMRALADATGEGCHLCVLRGADVLVLAAQESPARVRLSVEIGSSIEAARSASGRLLLACEPGIERDERLAAIRKRGYETARGETVEGVSDVAALIGVEHSTARAALAITGLARDHDAFVARCLPALRGAAEMIARAAGLTNLGASND